MVRKYHMVLHSPMGPRDGILTLDEDHGAVTGTLFILAHELPICGRRAADGCLYLVHRIITAVSEYPCRSILRNTGATVSGELQMDQSGAPWGWGGQQTKTVMPWSGEQLSAAEEEDS